MMTAILLIINLGEKQKLAGKERKGGMKSYSR